MQDFYGCNFQTITIGEIRDLIHKWKDAVITLDESLYKDAMKEFSITSMIGFGVDGAEADKLKDFESVRGSFDEDPFVAAVRQHIREKSLLADEMLHNLSAIHG